MQAVIMAGGEGSRLRPLTSNMPKPMLPVANRPLMEHIIELLRAHGVTDLIATVQFLSTVIRNYFGDGADLGVSLSYATEEAPLGTAGSVLGARDLLTGPCLVVSGDALTDVNLGEVVEFHRAREASATLVLKRMQDPLEFGIVMTAEDGRIERFLEKPTWGQVFSDTINTGIYVLEPEVLDFIPPEQPYDFAAEVFPAMLDKGLPVYGFVTDAYWTDVGNPEAYMQAHRDVLAGRVSVNLRGFELRPNVWMGEDVDAHPDARIVGPSLVGDNVRVGEGASVGPYAVIGDNTIVGRDARVVQSVVMAHAQVGRGAQVRGAVLARGSSLDRGASVEDGAVIGEEVAVGAGAIVKPHVKIYPSRTVEAGAIVTESVVRERRASRSLFGARGVSGVVNLGITPLTAARLGMAYGSTLKRGSVVVTGRDASRAARTMKRAIIAGLNSAGVTCHDLELAPMPLTRFTVRTQQAAGGITVRTPADDPEIVEVRLFDRDGIDLGPTDQRKIERIYFRDDYRRASPGKLGELEFPARTLQQYASGLVRSVDADAVRRAGLKVVVDYAFGAASLIGPSIVGRLGCDVLAVGAVVDEHRPVLVADDLERLLAGLSEHVRKSGSDMGVLLEPGGEIAHVVDGGGRRITHEQALLAFIVHETRGRGAATVAVPVSCPLACEELATANGATIQWTSTALPALMERAGRPGVDFAGNSEGALIWPGFMPAPDALMTLCKALELCATAGSLADAVDDLPAVHVARRDVATPWAFKGAVMRHIASSASPGKVLLLDGVKVVQDDRWVLVIPYADAPVCRVWAEAPTAEEARELADRYARMVQDVVADRVQPEVTY